MELTNLGLKIRAGDLAIGNIKQTAGQIYNVGGGAKITLSLLELLDLLEKKLSRKIPFTFADWRPGDQPVYISNIAKITKSLDWQPKIGVEEGTSKMIDWIVKEKDLIEKVLR
ncbi:MAG: CDP-paratose 2-epimerase [candidate division CPR1 bacterium GW2011_GWA2_42_17]|uniref:CDP-paratose 2-epimerase n=1 Tax=candidate division CPR1 bacterium GW2011_GWA2_42_17 TaxID=1618341 RepID=A0A0G0YWX8_9BACT|nr:MAG: CDP-paratose 2-epimerase [candidate division CPR1 bacterium GW2011_GWA2_42_17]